MSIRRAPPISVIVTIVLSAAPAAPAQFVEAIDLPSLAPPDGAALDVVLKSSFSGTDVAHVGDVNGDGHGDLLIGAFRTAEGTELNAGRVYVVFGGPSLRTSPPADLTQLDGTDGFHVPGFESAGFVGEAVAAAGDVNGDGIADLLFSGHGQSPGLGAPGFGEAYILFGAPGLGAGGQVSLAQIPLGAGVLLEGWDEVGTDFSRSVAGIGDVNGDGFDDVAVGASRADGPRVVLHPPIEVTGLAAGDLDGDGREDLVSTSFYHNSFTRYINQGGLAFADPKTAALNSDPQDATFVDYDLDGDLDLVFSNTIFESGPNKLFGRASVRPNNGVGAFGNYQHLFVGEGGLRLTTGDIDADGDIDVLAVHHQWPNGPLGNELVAVKNDTVGAAGNPQTIPTGMTPVSVVAGDWDADGDLDAAVSTDGPYTLELFRNNGAGGFSATFTKNLSQPIRDLEAADLDGDLDLDIVGVNASRLWIFEGLGSGAFADGIDLKVESTSPNTLEIADLNGDGAIDLVTANHDATGDRDMSVLRHVAGLAFEQLHSSVGGDADSLAITDLDLDGDADVAVGMKFDPDVEVRPNRGDGTFPGIDSGRAFVLFGGSPAMASGTISLDSVGVGDGFVVDGEAAAARLGDDVAGLGDVDGDGFDDFVITASRSDQTSPRGGRAYVYYGGPSLGATGSVGTEAADLTIEGTETDGGVGRSAGGAGDFDGDGFDDLLLGFSSPGAAGGVLVVRGGASLGGSIGTDTIDGSNGFRVEGKGDDDALGVDVAGGGDVNGDGLDDILLGGRDAASFPGRAVLIYGMPSPFPAATVQTSTVDGVTGTELLGVDSGDRAGEAVSIAGDLDGDGLDDAVIGAPWADPGGATQGGTTYVLFGVRRSLAGDVARISLASGGIQSLSLDAGPAHAGASYLVLGSGTGATPGFTFDGVKIPLNVDPYTLLTISSPNSPLMPASLGTLDADGRAATVFQLPPGLPASLAGVVLRHAFVATAPNGVVTFASNQVPVILDP